MSSFFVGKTIELTLFGEEGFLKGRVLRSLEDLDNQYILFLPEGSMQGEYVAATSISRIRVVGIVDIPEPKNNKKKPRRNAKGVLPLTK